MIRAESEAWGQEGFASMSRVWSGDGPDFSIDWAGGPWTLPTVFIAKQVHRKYAVMIFTVTKNICIF